MELKNKHPVWSFETESYVLNFHGRVTRVQNTKKHKKTSFFNPFFVHKNKPENIINMNMKYET